MRMENEKIYDMFKDIMTGCFFEYQGAVYIKTDFAENSEFSEIYNCVNLGNGFHEWIDPNNTVEIVSSIWKERAKWILIQIITCTFQI